jgi:hypothetical protein
VAMIARGPATGNCARNVRRERSARNAFAAFLRVGMAPRTCGCYNNA